MMIFANILARGWSSKSIGTSVCVPNFIFRARDDVPLALALAEDEEEPNLRHIVDPARRPSCSATDSPTLFLIIESDSEIITTIIMMANKSGRPFTAATGALSHILHIRAPYIWELIVTISGYAPYLSFLFLPAVINRGFV